MMYQGIANNTFFSDAELANRYRASRSTIWRWVKEANFPKPIKLTPGCTRWRLSDIEEWEKSRFGGAV